MRKLHRRLIRLERSCVPTSCHPWVVCVDRDGVILDDGTELTRPWVGRHYHELESVLLPRSPLKVLVGVDPLVVLGMKDG